MKHIISILAVLVLVGCGSDKGYRVPCIWEITKAGEYTLDHDMDLGPSAVCAIGIFADNVHLNLNGHRLTGRDERAVETFGVYSIGVDNVTVENGQIERFGYGVALTDPVFAGGSVRGLVVRNMTIRKSGYIGIAVEGWGSTVLNSTVDETGGGSFQSLKYVYGIAIQGTSCLISGNTVSETYPDRPSAEGVAFSFGWNNSGCVMEGNTVTQSVPTTDKNTFGVWVDVYSTMAIRNNTISGMHYSGVVPPPTELTNNNLDVPMIHVITDRN